MIDRCLGASSTIWFLSAWLGPSRVGVFVSGPVGKSSKVQLIPEGDVKMGQVGVGVRRQRCLYSSPVRLFLRADGHPIKTQRTTVDAESA